MIPTTSASARVAPSAQLVAKTDAQARYIDAIETADVVFAIGPAGTGKTYVAAMYAARELLAKRIDRIIITRPNIEVGAGMGFLPGELEEKYAPFLAPFREVMIQAMGKTHYEYALKVEKISPQPLAYMRGATFRNAIVILDEAQNCTPAEMKMFLTRIGDDCVVIVDGDTAQCDLSGPSGLNDALCRLKDVPGVHIVEFEEDDIVRSGIVRDILKAYRR
ncbi:PhoH family protein [Polaromonas sp. P1(28)-13]|nr:PhoH family protein [Polaromonas sp. P1(28)-13]